MPKRKASYEKEKKRWFALLLTNSTGCVKNTSFPCMCWPGPCSLRGGCLYKGWINPHFMMNVLNIVHACLLHDPDTAEVMALLGKHLRFGMQEPEKRWLAYT